MFRSEWETQTCMTGVVNGEIDVRLRWRRVWSWFGVVIFRGDWHYRDEEEEAWWPVKAD